MKLVRLAIIALASKPRQKLAPWAIKDDAVTVSLNPTEVKGSELIAPHSMIATIDLAISTVTADGYLEVPAKERISCESAIARAADILAIVTGCGRNIFTSTPGIAFQPETAEDRELLGQVRGIRREDTRPISTFEPQFPAADLVPLLADRWVGATLLAEAYSHNRMSGRYRELVRFFESAYGCSFTTLQKKLYQTLRPAFRYSVEEIRAWQNLRHPFTHADGQRSPEIALEEDARGIIMRMEQAALDVLCNKSEWGTMSRVRREKWLPTCFTDDKSGHGVIRQGTKASVKFMVIDPYGAFPMFLGIKHDSLPLDWLTDMARAADPPAAPAPV